MKWVLWLLASSAFNITAKDIGLPTSTGTVSQGIASILAAVMGVVGGLALIFVVVGALQYVLSAGDAKRTATAKNTILYAAVGVAVALGGYALVVFISNATKIGK